MTIRSKLIGVGKMEGAIYSNGKKGDIVVLDNVIMSDIPLSNYRQPAFFAIVEVKWQSDNSRDDKDMLYVLKDMFGKEFSVNVDAGWWLVELTTWAKAKEKYYTDKFNEEHLRTEKLYHQIEILKDILIHQGIRIVSEEQLKELDIKKTSC